MQLDNFIFSQKLLTNFCTNIFLKIGMPADHALLAADALLAAENAIILVSGDKRIARVGEHEYQVGDVIGRYKISEISSKGVVLSEAQ